MYLTNHGLAQLLGKVCLGLLGTTHNGDQAALEIAGHLRGWLCEPCAIKYESQTHLRLDDGHKVLRADLAVLIADSWKVKY